MASIFRLLKCNRRWRQVVLLGLLLWLPLPRALAATDTFYNYDGLLNQTGIQATNFYNDAVFTINMITNTVDFQSSLYREWQYVRNFTNTVNGLMDSTTGFKFYNRNPGSGDTASANFFNAGPINCDIYNTNFIYYSIPFAAFSYGGYGGIDVWATNIYNNGPITTGVDGLARFTGNYLNFDSSSVVLEDINTIIGFRSFSQFATPYTLAKGQTDISTNGWYPGFELGPTSASSGFMKSAPYSLDLTNSTSYFLIRRNSATNYVVKMIFLQDASVNVATNVYFERGLFSDGTAHVEWVGTYTDPASGQPVTTYLYLDNNYDAGSGTNILKYGSPGVGIPNNYTIFSTSVPRSLGAPETNNFFNGLVSPDAVRDNIFSYVNAELIPTDVSTNVMLNYAPGLLPGRVELNATKSLNLAQASFSGMNYLLLNSTNQFDTDSQYPVPAPYSDIYLGRTNNSMTFSNVIASVLPRWSGTVEAWTTTWNYNDTNNVINNPLLPPGNTNVITYDFRVLLVSSRLTPFSPSREGTVKLYSSNNVVISDVLNITSNLFLNCTNLLVTTNGPGNGAASLDGELNLFPTTFLWGNATTRLRCLTNNGAIRTQNPTSVQQFGSNSLPYLGLYNSGLITNAGGMNINALGLENYGVIFAGAGSFTAKSLTATMSNALVQAGTTFSITASDTVLANTAIQAGKSLTIITTNRLTDYGVIGGFWSLGEGYAGFPTGSGLVLPNLPPVGDLLGTTITNTVIAGIRITNVWAGTNRGYSNAGFQNNVALGQLVLDARASSSKFVFVGTGISNAIYVDCLHLRNYCSFTNRANTNLPPLSFNNLVIYYAQAIDDADGTSVAEKINGFNTNCLRWVPTYAGYFSSTNIVYPDGTTNAVNAALAASPSIDSDRDGSPNSVDPTPVLVTSQVPFTLTLTTNVPLRVRLAWQTIPLAGNYIYYSTNLATTNWLPFTNFTNYYFGPVSGPGTAVTKTNAGNYFISPQPYINASPSDNWLRTNVWIFDGLTNGPRYYRVMIQPN